MGATTVQVNGPRYEKTTDPKRMLTHAVLSEAIRRDWENIRSFLPARTATSLEYQAGARKAKAWNEGEGKISIDLPLEDGWYVPDGNPFAIPNGQKTNAENPDALYLYRHQDRSFSGPVGRDDYFVYRRYVFTFDGWSDASGVALVGRFAAAPLETATGTHSAAGLQLMRNPTELIVRGTSEQLDAAVRLLESLK
ncbi:MAG: hypothetical protein Q7S22_08100 [Candidatus Micrarchaeota archaeon]|nr:hypothetical protein [Candidatus Micrarchaeota archaeon]